MNVSNSTEKFVSHIPAPQRPGSPARKAWKQAGGLAAAGTLALSLAVASVGGAQTNQASEVGAGNVEAGMRTLQDQQAATISIVNHVLPAVVHVSAEIPAGRGGQDEGDGIDNGDGGAAPQMPFGGRGNPFGGSPFGGNPFGGAPFGGGPRQHSGPGLASGSGIIIDPSGIIITNRHVVENARNVTVQLTDRRIFKGTVYSDPNIDLAVIKINANGPLPYARMAENGRLQIGQSVMAIGYPFDVGETVSRGIISALGRSQTIEGQFYPGLVQTDASINPGNSGGALVDLNGNVIGVNTAIAGAAGQSAGIGFAIPATTVNVVWPQLANGTHKITNYPKGWIRGKLGVEVRPVTPDLDKVLGVDEGALVASVQADSAGAKAGLQAGDVIESVNGTPVRDAEELVDVIGNLGPNQDANIVVMRNHQRVTLTAVTGGYGATHTAAAVPTRGRIGLSVAPLSADNRDQLQLPDAVTQGLVVRNVADGSPASDAGFQANDVIVSVNGQAVHTQQQLVDIVSAARPGDSLGVRIYRGKGSMYLVVQLPEGQNQ